ncbi:MAG TPA: glycine oxidase ThiO, partial [Gammaproteobacteria bacterium]
IVVGAGIFGLLTARELGRNGLSVLIIEKGQPGREASRAAAGILSPLYPWRAQAPLQALAHWSQQYYPVLVDDLRRDTAIDPELVNSGMLVFGDDERQIAQAWARYSARPLDILQPRQVTVCEPALGGSRPRPAVFLPTVSHIHSSRFMRALTESVYGSGIPIREEVAVTGILSKDGRVAGVATAEGDIPAERVVICAGAWSGGLLESVGVRGNIRPVKGQVIQFDGPPGLLSRVLLDRGCYIIPRRNGKIVVGSTLEETGFDRATTQEARDELQESAARVLPALGNLNVERHWCGLRPATRDELPYIGAHPELRGLYLNTGHFRHGLTTAPASARLLADVVLERSPILDPSEYNPAR